MNSLFINETALHTRPLHPPPFPLLSAPSCLGDGVGGGGGTVAFCRLLKGARL
jgi:hypothetical protein